MIFEKRQRERIPDDQRPIVLDANVIVDIMRTGRINEIDSLEWGKKNLFRLVTPDVVTGEVIRVLNGKASEHMSIADNNLLTQEVKDLLYVKGIANVKKFPWYENKQNYSGYKHDKARIYHYCNKIAKKYDEIAKGDPLVDIGLNWLIGKSTYLKRKASADAKLLNRLVSNVYTSELYSPDIVGTVMVTRLSSTVNITKADRDKLSKYLSLLSDKAESDREIMGVTCMVAEQAEKVHLVSNDTDMLILKEFLEDITENKLDVIWPMTE